MSHAGSSDILKLSENEKKYLLKLARETIHELLTKNRFLETQPPTKKLEEKYGVFVTLYKNGNLRGCIGYVEGSKPVYRAVMEMAKSAAFEDPRFPPLTLAEFSQITIEISILSPLRRIHNVDEIQVGIHGIVISRGFSRGLLLPQVATEWNWDREQFLEQTCLKAGLPPDAWKDPETEIWIFSAEIFSEKDVFND